MTRYLENEIVLSSRTEGSLYDDNVLVHTEGTNWWSFKWTESDGTKKALHLKVGNYRIIRASISVQEP
jgi:hypothetical protein